MTGFFVVHLLTVQDLAVGYNSKFKGVYLLAAVTSKYLL
jgi:hypothetical protein